MLEAAALRGRDGDGMLVDASAKELSGCATGEFFQDRWLFGLENEAVGWVGVQADAAVAGHGFGDVDKQGLGDRKARVVFEDVDDLLVLAVLLGRAAGTPGGGAGGVGWACWARPGAASASVSASTCSSSSSSGGMWLPASRR